MDTSSKGSTRTIELLKRPQRKRRVNLDFWKCKACRDAKQKCQPSQRQWPGERCQRCIQRRLPCSQPDCKKQAIIRASKKDTSPSYISKEAPVASQGSRQLCLQAGTVAGAQITDVQSNDIIYQQDSRIALTPVSDEGGTEKLCWFMALVHITNVIKESRRSLDYLAKSMASLLEGDAKHDYYMGCLPNVLLEYENFDRVLTDEIRGTRCTSEVLNDTLVMPTLSSLCSRNPDPIRLNFVQKSVIHAQELGNYGQAFIMLVQLGLENRGGLSSNNRLALSRNRLRLLHWIKAVLQRDEIKPFVPKSIGDASSLLLSSGNYPSWVVEEHQAGNDCLHRSTFHLALDLHLPAPWPPTDIDHQDVLGRTVLYIACSIGDEGLVQRLLQCNAKIHKCTVTGLNPVHVAAIKGYTSISTSLLAKELQNGFLHSTLIAGDCIGRNPLHYACMGGHIEMVQSFCEHSSILVLGRDKFGYSAMTLAVQANQLEIVRWLLPYNLSSDLPDMMGRTPFWYAIHFKHLEIMRALGEVANIEHQDYAGRTPLAEAARAGFKEGVRYLLGFNSAAGDEYWRPIEIKCNPNSKDHQGKSPLVLAAEGGHTKCFQLLIRHKPLQYQREDLVQAANAAESAGHGNLVSLIDINELLSSSFSRRI